MAWTDIIDGQRFTQDFIQRKAARAVGDFFDTLGEEGLYRLLATDQPISSQFTEEGLQVVYQKGRQYSWASQVLTAHDITLMVPDWAKLIIARGGPEANDWLRRQVAWLQEVFQEVQGGAGIQR